MAEKIQVLQFVRVLDRGGIEAFIFNNYKVMDRDRIGYGFFLLREQEEAYERELADYGCRKICVDVAPDAPMQVRRLPGLIRIFHSFRRAEWDMIHFHSVSPSLSSAIIVLLAALAGVRKRIIHAHLAVDTRPFGMLRRVKYHVAKNLICAVGTDFLACSGLAADYYFTERVKTGRRFQIVNNAIDVSKYRFLEAERRSVRRALDIEDCWVIGNIGRFVGQKNHEFMLRVFQTVLKRRADAVLLLVGGEVDSEKGRLAKIRRMAAELGLDGKVIFTGESGETARLLQAMDVFLFPSLFEGLGIAAVEAQAAGLPVVCSSNYIPRELNLTGAVAWLDLEEPVERWADALLTAGHGDRGSAWRVVEQAGYTVGRTAGQLEQLYTDIKKRNKP